MQAFSADAPIALVDAPECRIEVRLVGAPTLLAPWAAFQGAPQQPDQALAVTPGHPFHVVQHASLLSLVGFRICRTHLAQVLVHFIDRHRVVCGHHSSG